MGNEQKKSVEEILEIFTSQEIKNEDITIYGSLGQGVCILSDKDYNLEIKKGQIAYLKIKDQNRKITFAGEEPSLIGKVESELDKNNIPYTKVII